MRANRESAAQAARRAPLSGCGSFPAELMQWLADWCFAWRWRRKMRRLLALEELGQVRLGSVHPRVSAGARMPLRKIVARQAEWRRTGCAPD